MICEKFVLSVTIILDHPHTYTFCQSNRDTYSVGNLVPFTHLHFFSLEQNVKVQMEMPEDHWLSLSIQYLKYMALTAWDTEKQQNATKLYNPDSLEIHACGDISATLILCTLLHVSRQFQS